MTEGASDSIQIYAINQTWENHILVIADKHVSLQTLSQDICNASRALYPNNTPLELPLLIQSIRRVRRLDSSHQSSSVLAANSSKREDMTSLSLTRLGCDVDHSQTCENPTSYNDECNTSLSIVDIPLCYSVGKVLRNDDVIIVSELRKVRGQLSALRQPTPRAIAATQKTDNLTAGHSKNLTGTPHKKRPTGTILCGRIESNDEIPTHKKPKIVAHDTRVGSMPETPTSDFINQNDYKVPRRNAATNDSDSNNSKRFEIVEPAVSTLGVSNAENGLSQQSSSSSSSASPSRPSPHIQASQSVHQNEGDLDLEDEQMFADAISASVGYSGIANGGTRKVGELPNDRQLQKSAKSQPGKAERQESESESDDSSDSESSGSVDAQPLDFSAEASAKKIETAEIRQEIHVHRKSSFSNDSTSDSSSSDDSSDSATMLRDKQSENEDLELTQSALDALVSSAGLSQRASHLYLPASADRVQRHSVGSRAEFASRHTKSSLSEESDQSQSRSVTNSSRRQNEITALLRKSTPTSMLSERYGNLFREQEELRETRQDVKAGQHTLGSREGIAIASEEKNILASDQQEVSARDTVSNINSSDRTNYAQQTPESSIQNPSGRVSSNLSENLPLHHLTEEKRLAKTSSSVGKRINPAKKLAKSKSRANSENLHSGSTHTLSASKISGQLKARTSAAAKRKSAAKARATELLADSSSISLTPKQQSSNPSSDGLPRDGINFTSDVAPADNDGSVEIPVATVLIPPAKTPGIKRKPSAKVKAQQGKRKAASTPLSKMGVQQPGNSAPGQTSTEAGSKVISIQTVPIVTASVSSGPKTTPSRKPALNKAKEKARPAVMKALVTSS